MLMSNENVQLYPHDKIMNVIAVRYLPRWITPNQLTILRFSLIPIVVWLISEQNWDVGIPLFLFAAFTDLLDGSLARIRKQITIWGTLADPAADKLLIGSVALLTVVQQLGWSMAWLIIGVELLIVGSGLVRRKQNWVLSANWAGKIKMLLQVIGVTLLLISASLGLPALLPIAAFVLWAAIIIAIISLFTYSL
ncbi:MAG: CDP-alcohol phosphatidyltransferase family protein [Patescibacteria group bacterium]|jgi:CDP-diacylglycerol--glycerol-3-phosphate 3-phosphatidyltransferase